MGREKEKGRRVRRDRRGKPEFLESDGDLDAIGGLGGVKINIGGFLGRRHGEFKLFGQLGETRQHMRICSRREGKEGKTE